MKKISKLLTIALAAALGAASFAATADASMKHKHGKGCHVVGGKGAHHKGGHRVC